MDENMIAWIGLGGVAVGALISFLSTSFSDRQRHKQELALRQQQRMQDRKDVGRERLEELYILAKHWMTGIGHNYLSLSSAMQGKITYNEHLDLAIEWAKEGTHDFARLEMILDIYGTKVRSGFDTVIEARTQLNKIAAKFKHDYEAGLGNSESFLGPYVEAQKQFEAAEKQFLTQIATAAIAS